MAGVSSEVFRIPPDPQCPRPGRPWPATRRPLQVSDPQVERLFARGGPLANKKKTAVLLRGVFPSGAIDVYGPGDEMPLPNTKHHEYVFLVALLHELGWPDAAGEPLLADAVYYTMRIAIECDESQHLDMQHYFNRLKPDYQRPRDERVGIAFVERGFYYLRVLACDPVPGQPGRWRDTDLETVYRRTREAVRMVYKERKEAQTTRLNYDGRLLVWPDDENTSIAQTYYRSNIVNAASHATDADKPFARAAQSALREKLDRVNQAVCRPLPRGKSIAHVVHDIGAEPIGALIAEGEEEEEEEEDHNEDLIDGYPTLAVLPRRMAALQIAALAGAKLTAAASSNAIPEPAAVRESLNLAPNNNAVLATQQQQSRYAAYWSGALEPYSIQGTFEQRAASFDASLTM